MLQGSEGRQIWAGEDREERVDMGGPPASWGHGDVRAWTAAKGCVFVQGLGTSVLMSMTPVTTEGPTDSQSLGCHL